ncbi:DUF2231 domain-containing protein [Adhaeribacter terreus]|uniref:DUF2231 domain-containing protein n=1 Tax=Adhaeribacter terreus TaxID=529703 RepID=A0ABW0EEN8_9BACT
MKLDYHPPHLILVHFPSALFPVEFAFAAIGYYRHDLSFSNAAFYVLAAGVLLGWLAAFAGLIDLSRIPKEKATGQRTGLIHGGLNVLVLSGYTVLAILQYKAPEISYATVPQLLLKAFLLLLLIAGNYLGGQLVLKYKIGTLKNDKTQS